MNLGSRLNSPHVRVLKTADVSNLLQIYRKWEKGQKIKKKKNALIIQMGGTAGLCDLLINKLYTENQGIKIITDQADCEHLGKNP